MTAVRCLLPVPSDPAAEIDLADYYARDWLPTGGVRVNFIASADGGIAVDGVSRGLQTDGDNRVFAVLRDQADVVLAGSGTVRAEGYEALHLSAERRAARTALGLREHLPTAVVSGRLGLDPGSALFATRDGEPRPVVITHGAAPEHERAALAEVADVIVAGEHEVDLPDALRQLATRGLTRVLCEGGPSLFADAAAAGVLSELCLTVSPTLAGPGASRVVAGTPWPSGRDPLGLRLRGLLEEDGALFCRYTPR